jgi:hypothetical protein
MEAAKAQNWAVEPQGKNMDPYFSTVDSVVKNPYTQLMYVCNFYEENEGKKKV